MRLARHACQMPSNSEERNHAHTIQTHSPRLLPGDRLRLATSLGPEHFAWATSRIASSKTPRATPTPGTAPTLNAYDRPIPTGDDQIGPHWPTSWINNLKMSYSHDLPEYNRRYVHFRSVMDEWDKSPKGVDRAGADDPVAQDVDSLLDARVARLPAADADRESDRLGQRLDAFAGRARSVPRRSRANCSDVGESR